MPKRASRKAAKMEANNIKKAEVIIYKNENAIKVFRVEKNFRVKRMRENKSWLEKEEQRSIRFILTA